MLFKETKDLHTYNAGDIIGFHKYAYYGDVRRFKMVATSTLIEEYIESIYYCINYGCRRNIEFAEFVLDEIEFVDNKYKMSITATYIRNGKYDSRLYLKKFDYSLYRNIAKDDVKHLLKYEELHDILCFISALNSFELIISPSYLHPINKLKYFYNLPDDSESKKITDFWSFVLSPTRYTLGGLDIYSFTIPPGDYANICNIESELLFAYLNRGHKENEVLTPLTEVNIMNDVRFAIESYSKNHLMDYCLSKFVIISPSLSLELVKKHKPFLVFGNSYNDFNYLDKYIEINPLYRHNFIYSGIMYHCIDIRQYIGDDIDYCYIEACIKSCNPSVLLLLKKMNKKCYKRLDYANNKYIEELDEIEVDYDEISKKLRLDVSSYKFIS